MNKGVKMSENAEVKNSSKKWLILGVSVYYFIGGIGG